PALPTRRSSDLGVTRAHEALLGQADGQRREAALVQRNALPDERAKDIEHDRARDRRRRVEVARARRRRAGEIDRRRTALAVDLHAYRDTLAAVDLERPFAVGEPGDRVAHALLGVALDVLHVALHDVETVALDELAELRGAACVRCELRFQV